MSLTVPRILGFFSNGPGAVGNGVRVGKGDGVTGRGMAQPGKMRSNEMSSELKITCTCRMLMR
jgi:hypothetical protein